MRQLQPENLTSLFLLPTDDGLGLLSGHIRPAIEEVFNRSAVERVDQGLNRNPSADKPYCAVQDFRIRVQHIPQLNRDFDHALFYPRTVQRSA